MSMVVLGSNSVLSGDLRPLDNGVASILEIRCLDSWAQVRLYEEGLRLKTIRSELDR